ncbi:MAG TPA: hypothetical protein V6C78_00510 [Crinalium sp.]
MARDEKIGQDRGDRTQTSPYERFRFSGPAANSATEHIASGRWDNTVRLWNLDGIKQT